jgi:hypothetical protein
VPIWASDPRRRTLASARSRAQLTGYEPVLRISGVVLAMRAASNRACSRAFSTAPFLRLLLSLCFEGRECGLNPKRLQTVQDFLCKGTIDPHAAKRDAAIGGHDIERAATDVALCGATWTAVCNIELPPAAPTAKETRQEGLTTSQRATAHEAFSIGIIGNQALIPFRTRPMRYIRHGGP